MKIEHKIALVTGGADGIGKAISQRLLEKGAKFVAILDINADVAQKTVQEFAEKFGKEKARFIHCDVSNDKRLKESFQEAFDVHGALDIVINNAGIMGVGNRRKAIEINLIAVVSGCFFAEELMTKEKREEKGVIVNTASMAGISVGGPFVNSNYCASKHGVVGLTKSLPTSADNFSKDLRVAAVCPALVLTNLYNTEEILKDDKIRGMIESYRNRAIDISVVVDGFILAIEDENLNGAIITANKEGVKVVE